MYQSRRTDREEIVSGSGGARRGESRGFDRALLEPDSFGGGMDTIRIRNWDRWQTYRSDRGLPPWIKVHRQILRNAEWVSLTDAQRGQLLSMWILAADKGGEIPACPKTLKILCHMEAEPDLQLFANAGFIDLGVNVTPTWRQPDANVTPSCGIGVGSDEGKGREGKGREAQTPCPAGAAGRVAGEGRQPKADPYDQDVTEILDYLNARRAEILPKARGFDTASKGNRRLPRARLAAGHPKADLIAVIDSQLEAWRDRTEMHVHFCPDTLFNETKFNKYLANVGVAADSEAAEMQKFLAMGDER